MHSGGAIKNAHEVITGDRPLNYNREDGLGEVLADGEDFRHSRAGHWIKSEVGRQHLFGEGRLERFCGRGGRSHTVAFTPGNLHALSLIPAKRLHALVIDSISLPGQQHPQAAIPTLEGSLARIGAAAHAGAAPARGAPSGASAALIEV